MPDAHLKYQLIAALLSLLEKERLHFGVDRHLKLQELMTKLPEDLSIAQLKQVLCPAIASSEQQQTLFYELFDEAWERVQEINKGISAPPPPPPPPARGLGWIIGLSILLLAVLGLIFWPKVEPDAANEDWPIIQAFSVPKNDTALVAPIDIRVAEWGPIRESYFCGDSLAKTTKDTSVFGKYQLIPATDSLLYIAKDSIGQDSICVTMVDSAGLRHQVIFKVRIVEPQAQVQPPPQEDEEPKPSNDIPKAFSKKPLPNFDEEIVLLQIEPPTKLEQLIAKNINWLRFLLIALTSLLLGFILYYLEQRRRTLVAQLESQDKPPYVWNIELDTAEDILVTAGFEQMVNALRQRTRQDYFKIDIPKSVSTTIEKAGMPSLEYRQQTRPPEYLMLIDRQSGANHRSKLFDWIYKALLEQEVFVERYFFDGDIRICFNEKHEEGISIAELQYLHPNARLLVFSHGYQFLSSRSGKMAKWTRIFDQWKQKTLFSPKPTQQWGRRESRLSDQFFLLPASMEGLQFFANEIEDLEELSVNAWKEVVTDAYEQPISLEGGLISSLRQYYSEEMLQWIAACAIYPDLHWDLTLFLGRQLSTEEAPLLTLNHLNSLTRLPWFVEGQIPDESRAVLVDYLEKEHPDILEEARLGVLAILKDNPPPPDSNAWNDYQMQLALNEWLTTKDKKRKKELEKEITELLPLIEADFVTIKYLDQPGPLDFIVPQQWKKYLHPEGYAGLGMRAWLKDLWWALPLWIGIIAGSFWYVPPEGCSGQVVEYEGKTLCLDEPWKELLYQKFLVKNAIERNNRDSVISLTNTRDSLFPAISWSGNPFVDTIIQNSPLRFDSLSNLEKLTYANASFNQYVARYHYNNGVDYANSADSLIRLNEVANLEIYLDSACYHFSEAWPLEPIFSDLERAHRLCSGTKVYVKVDQGLNITVGTQVRDSILAYGYPAFTIEQVPMQTSSVRYFYDQDSLAAVDILQMIQNRFAFGEEMIMEKALEVNEPLDTGRIEVWIDDNQPAEFVIIGQIMNSENFLPIQDATIIWNNQNFSSNSRGSFVVRLEQPIPNRITLNITQRNHVSKDTSFDITNNFNPYRILIELTPLPSSISANIERKVLDKITQRPIANAQIQCGGQNIRTNTNGDFRLRLDLPQDTSLLVFISATLYQSDSLTLLMQNGQLSLRQQDGTLVNDEVALNPLTPAIDDQDGDGVPDDQDRCPAIPGNANRQGCPLSITDTRDNQNYPLVIIGEQVWLGKNLNFATNDSWCYLELPQACEKAGRLYTWEAAKNACPQGWHLPDNKDWEKLLNFYDNDDSKAYRALIEGGDAGFNALLGGFRSTDGSFLYLGAHGYYWSATAYDGGVPYLYSFNSEDQRLYRYVILKGYGRSVRCLQN